MGLLITFSARYLYLFILLGAAIIFLSIGSHEKIMLIQLEFTTLPLAYVLARLVSKVIRVPRPYIVAHTRPLIPAAIDNGFPSDHTLLSLCVALSTFRFTQNLSLVLILLSLLVGIARVRARVHHMIDILGSIAITVTAYCIVTHFI